MGSTSEAISQSLGLPITPSLTLDNFFLASKYIANLTSFAPTSSSSPKKRNAFLFWPCKNATISRDAARELFSFLAKMI